MYAIFLGLKKYANDLTQTHIKFCQTIQQHPFLVYLTWVLVVQLHVTIYANKFGLGALNIAYG